jgi:anti-sigma factor RsiW
VDRHERMLIAFLAGDLDEESSSRWDEHLLGCERCWRAVREDRLGKAAAARLRESAPPELAERVRFAVELAGHPSRRPLRWVFAGGGLLAAALVTVIAVVLSTSTQPADPPTIAAVVRIAQDMPAPAATHSTAPGTPVLVGPPVEVIAAGAHVRLWYYQIGGVPAVVALSDQPFPMPSEAAPLSTGGMPWTATRGRVALYCPQSNVVIAAPVAASELPALASRLPLPG